MAQQPAICRQRRLVVIAEEGGGAGGTDVPDRPLRLIGHVMSAGEVISRLRIARFRPSLDTREPGQEPGHAPLGHTVLVIHGSLATRTRECPDVPAPAVVLQRLGPPMAPEPYVA